MHCDVKPNNILIHKKSTAADLEQLKTSAKLFLIDYGLCQKYIGTDSNHLFATLEDHLKGNIHFMSANQLKSLCKYCYLFWNIISNIIFNK